MILRNNSFVFEEDNMKYINPNKKLYSTEGIQGLTKVKVQI